jgi:hypothetical protein
MSKHFFTIGVSEKGGKAKHISFIYLVRRSIDDNSKSKFLQLKSFKGFVCSSRWSSVLRILCSRRERVERKMSAVYVLFVLFLSRGWFGSSLKFAWLSLNCWQSSEKGQPTVISWSLEMNKWMYVVWYSHITFRTSFVWRLFLVKNCSVFFFNREQCDVRSNYMLDNKMG